MGTGFDRRRLLQGSAAASALALAAPAVLRSASRQGGPIRIGFPTPLTGAFGAEANDQVRAAQLAIKEFNEGGGFQGRTAELLVRDDKLNPGEAATGRSNSSRRTRSTSSSAALGGGDAVDQQRRPRARGDLQLDQPVRRDQRSQGFRPDHLPRGPEPAHDAGGRRRIRLPEIRQGVAFLSADYAYGHEMVRGFKRAGEASGIEVVAEIRHPIGASDYSPSCPGSPR